MAQQHELQAGEARSKFEDDLSKSVQELTLAFEKQLLEKSEEHQKELSSLNAQAEERTLAIEELKSSHAAEVLRMSETFERASEEQKAIVVSEYEAKLGEFKARISELETMLGESDQKCGELHGLLERLRIDTIAKEQKVNFLK